MTDSSNQIAGVMPTGTNVVRFTLGGLRFEYDPEKNRKNIEKHGISFQSAARVFFDYDRIELYDEGHSETEDRYNTIGDTSAGNLTTIGTLQGPQRIDDILFVVYTERIIRDEPGKPEEVIRLISARMATSFERGVYYGKFG
jgi:uncharacterized DUF497 family protein